MPPILDSALDAVGNTPLVRLDRIAAEEGLRCNLLGKLEFTSAGGSIKDRIAKHMVLAAERDGILVPGKSVVIEPTSGNTGIGLALACVVRGYPVVITMPDKMSLEKEATLRALGAEVVRTPTSAPSDSPHSHIGVAHTLQHAIPHAVILDQYRNPNNPLAHQLTTGPEILAAIAATPPTPSRPSSGTLDALVAGAGTGGTITGISRAVKPLNPACIIVAVDPIGSILAYPDSLNLPSHNPIYAVEGIGYDFHPPVLSRDPADIDHWLKIADDHAFPAVARLIRTEGLLVGGSSGSALAGALAWLKDDRHGGGGNIARTPGANVVVVLPDGIRNYMSKDWFLDITLRAPPTPLASVIANALAHGAGAHPHP